MTRRHALNKAYLLAKSVVEKHDTPNSPHSEHDPRVGQGQGDSGKAKERSPLIGLGLHRLTPSKLKALTAAFNDPRQRAAQPRAYAEARAAARATGRIDEFDSTVEAVFEYPWDSSAGVAPSAVAGEAIARLMGDLISPEARDTLSRPWDTVMGPGLEKGKRLYRRG